MTRPQVVLKLHPSLQVDPMVPPSQGLAVPRYADGVVREVVALREEWQTWVCHQLAPQGHSIAEGPLESDSPGWDPGPNPMQKMK